MALCRGYRTSVLRSMLRGCCAALVLFVVCGASQELLPLDDSPMGTISPARAVLYESVGWQSRLGWGIHNKLLRWSPSPNQPSNMPPPNDSVGLTCNASADFTPMLQSGIGWSQ